MKLCCYYFVTVAELCFFVNFFKIKKENIQSIVPINNDLVLYYWQPNDAEDLGQAYVDYLMQKKL